MSLFSCKEIDTLAETMTGCLQGAVERVRVEDSVLREALNLLYQTSHVLHSLVLSLGLSTITSPKQTSLEILIYKLGPGFEYAEHGVSVGAQKAYPATVSVVK